MLRRYPKNRESRPADPPAPRLPRRPYDSDLSDDQWATLEPLLSARRSDTDRREIFNAILYHLRNGCSWRALPHDFPPRDRQRLLPAVAARRLDRSGPRRLAAPGPPRRRPRRRARCRVDREPVGQDHRAGGHQGFDAGKKVKGRKRPILVDTLGLLVAVVVHSAGIRDYDGARSVFERIKGSWPRLRLIWADSVYARRGLPAWASAECGRTSEVVKRSDDVKGFVVQPKRWVVERTFAWLGRYRRLSKDYERSPDTSDGAIKSIVINIMIRQPSKTAQVPQNTAIGA